MKALRSILFPACFVAMISIAGCGGPSKSSEGKVEVPEPSGPRINAECVMTYFDSDGSEYFTTQKHKIYIENGAIEIFAAEPEGDFAWYLSNGVFVPEKGDSSETPYKLCSNEIAHAISLSVRAGGGFMNEMPGLVKSPVNLSGQWYQPIQILPGTENPVKQTVLRNSNGSEIEWVFISNDKKDRLIAARNYNRLILNNSDNLMPSAIDIYNTDKHGKPDSRFMKVEYKSFELENI